PLDLPVGDKIDISLTLDTSFPDQNPSPNVGFYLCFFCSPPQLVGAANFGAVKFGGPTGFPGTVQDVDVLNNDMGVDEFMISTGFPHSGGCCFTILFKTSNLNILTSDAIPLFIDPTEFQTATFSVQPCVTPACISGFSGTIGAAGEIPEPSGLTLLGIGLVVTLVLRLYRIRPPIQFRGLRVFRKVTIAARRVTGVFIRSPSPILGSTGPSENRSWIP
ncbi:MAG TPA: hypothetical protein VKT80_07985, partial [Chloroflexota bacterium]|nr:hypothetical protein [Chloroflexota bacterium]